MVVSLLIRSGLIIGSIYYTRKLGVWGDTDQTQQLYESIKNQLEPHVIAMEKSLPFEVPSLPERGEVRYLAKHYYNQGVKETFHFIHMLPCYTGQALNKAKLTFKEFSQSPPTEPPSTSN